MGYKLFDIVLYSTFIGSVTALCIILLRFLTRNIFCKQYHYYLWIIFAIRLIFPISIPSDVSLYNVFANYQLEEGAKYFEEISTAGKSAVNVSAINVSAINVSAINTAKPDLPNDENETSITNTYFADENKPHNERVNYNNKNSDIIEKVWLFGAAVMLFIYGTTYILTIKKAKHSNEVKENIKDILIEMKKKAGINYNINICENNFYLSPCVMGIFKPTIIIQDKITDSLSSDKIKHILLHEIVHIKRKDNVINMLLMLLMCIYWFNPLFWYCIKLIRDDCELSCDEKVLNIISTEKSTNYAQTLLDTVMLTNKCNKLSFNIFFAKSNTKERIKNIMKYKKKSMYIFIVFILVLAVAAAMLLTDKSENVNISKQSEADDYIDLSSDFIKLSKKKDENFEFDIRSKSKLSKDFTNHLEDLLYTSFDSSTRWPDKMPDGFNPEEVVEIYKNPGLNIRELHEQNITGKGVGIAIIDHTLRLDHVEYEDRLKLYENNRNPKERASFHGVAVASIAVGKTVGVAPEADLYYISGDMSAYDGSFENDYKLLADNIDRVLEINDSLPEENKIRVIAIPARWTYDDRGYDEVNAAVERAKEEGIFVVSASLDDTYELYFDGLGREPLSDADDFNSYRQGSWWEFNDNHILRENTLLFPMDFKCTAGHNGKEDYAVFASGGWDLIVPYIAGVYALACQVEPEITGYEFWELALETGVSINLENQFGQEYELKTIINPVGIMESLKSNK